MAGGKAAESAKVKQGRENAAKPRRRTGSGGDAARPAGRACGVLQIASLSGSASAVCNEVARRIALGQIRVDFSQLKIVLRFSEGLPNLAAQESIRITDSSPIIRIAPAGVAGKTDNDASGETEADMVQRRWSWPAPTGRPVYNYRSEGRAFGNSAKGGRCLIPIDGFYEFTAPADPRAKRKDKWRFTQPDVAFFCVAGLWRADPKVGEAFTMLTCEPGADVAPYHDRQIVLMPRDRWADWIAGVVPAAALIAPTPAGTLRVERV